MSEMKKRLIMCVAGVFLSGVAAGTFGFTAFGMDPFQVFAHGLNNLVPLSYGLFQFIMPMTGWFCVHTIISIFDSVFS